MVPDKICLHQNRGFFVLMISFYVSVRHLSLNRMAAIGSVVLCAVWKSVGPQNKSAGVQKEMETIRADADAKLVESFANQIVGIVIKVHLVHLSKRTFIHFIYGCCVCLISVPLIYLLITKQASEKKHCSADIGKQ